MTGTSRRSLEVLLGTVGWGSAAGGSTVGSADLEEEETRIESNGLGCLHSTSRTVDAAIQAGLGLSRKVVVRRE